MYDRAFTPPSMVDQKMPADFFYENDNENENENLIHGLALFGFSGGFCGIVDMHFHFFYSLLAWWDDETR